MINQSEAMWLQTLPASCSVLSKRLCKLTASSHYMFSFGSVWVICSQLVLCLLNNDIFLDPEPLSTCSPLTTNEQQLYRLCITATRVIIAAVTVCIASLSLAFLALRSTDSQTCCSLPASASACTKSSNSASPNLDGDSEGRDRASIWPNRSQLSGLEGALPSEYRYPWG